MCNTCCFHLKLNSFFFFRERVFKINIRDINPSKYLALKYSPIMCRIPYNWNNRLLCVGNNHLSMRAIVNFNCPPIIITIILFGVHSRWLEQTSFMFQLQGIMPLQLNDYCIHRGLLHCQTWRIMINSGLNKKKQISQNIMKIIGGIEINWQLMVG